MAQRIDAELYVLYIDVGETDEHPTDQRSLRFAENLGTTLIRSKGKNIAEEVARIVKENHITQVVFGRSAQSGWKWYLYFQRYTDFFAMPRLLMFIQSRRK